MQYILNGIKIMENKQITVNIPEGHTLKEEKTDNGLILTFVKEEKIDIEQKKIDFFRECLNGCTIRLEKDYPNSVFYDKVFYNKKEETLFELQKTNGGTLYFWTDYLLIWDVFQNKYKMQFSDTQQFIKTQAEMIFKIGEIIPARRNINTKLGWKR